MLEQHTHNIKNTVLKNNFLLKLVKLLITLSLTSCIILLSVKLTLNFKYLYYYDIDKLNISSYSNLSTNEIKKNYNYLILFLNKDLNVFKLPSLPSSTNAIEHFWEVKKIFKFMDRLFYILMPMSTVGIYIQTRKNSFDTLKWSSLLLMFAPFILIIPLIINFDKSFTLFHKLLFNNNYWLFDTKKDPVITILPKEFFLHCALLILFFMFLCSIFMLGIYFKHKIKSATHH